MKKGDRVKLKGREPCGVVDTMAVNYEIGYLGVWVCVRWDADKPGPKYVHELELEMAA